MSLRPEIVGFSLAKMRSHFGSKDAGTLEHIAARLEPVAEEIEEEAEDEARVYREKFSETARAIVMDGAPVAGLKTEEDIHFDIAQVLATYDQKPHGVQSNGWKMNAFWEFHRAYGRKLDAGAQPLLDFLISGRPLFGSAMAIDWSYYSYLTHDEVVTLLTALRKLQTAEPSLVGENYLDGFVDTLSGWLAEIDERGLDLFLYAT
jgi:AcrR family transcriptional regulator